MGLLAKFQSTVSAKIADFSKSSILEEYSKSTLFSPHFHWVEKKNLSRQLRAAVALSGDDASVRNEFERQCT